MINLWPMYYKISHTTCPQVAMVLLLLVIEGIGIGDLEIFLGSTEINNLTLE
jgi:hypothetical protein